MNEIKSDLPQNTGDFEEFVKYSNKFVDESTEKATNIRENLKRGVKDAK